MRTAFLTTGFLLGAVCSSWAGTLVVAQDGSGHFQTIQRAIAAIPDHSSNRTVIRIKAGKYRGPILLPETKTNVTFLGEKVENTVLSYGRSYDDLRNEEPGNRYRGCTVAILADDFRAENTTFENVAHKNPASASGRAMALRVDGDRAEFFNCRVLGWQGTLMAEVNRQYFRNCYVEGHSDFICGSATAVFDRCEIHSRKGGYVVLPSTPRERPFGFVFLECNLTGDGEPAYLGRPWAPYAGATYVGCEMASHIKTVGWHNRDTPGWESTVRFAEYNSRGPGANAGFGRVPWSRQLTKEEAETYTVETVLAGMDGWVPDASSQ